MGNTTSIDWSATPTSAARGRTRKTFLPPVALEARLLPPGPGCAAATWSSVAIDHVDHLLPCTRAQPSAPVRLRRRPPVAPYCILVIIITLLCSMNWKRWPGDRP